MKAVIKVIVKGIMKVIFNVKVIGKENIPTDGKVVICSNHIDALDGPLVVAFIKREVNFIAKKELWENKLVAYILDKYNMISIDRERPTLETFKAAKEALDSGRIVGVFPEGTRNGLAKGEDPKAGAVMIATANDARILPIKLAGNYQLFHGIKIIIGEPFKLQKAGKAARTENINIVMHAIENIEVPTKSKTLVKKALN